MRTKSKIDLIGFVGRGPETQETPGGTRITRFSMATTDRWNDKAGQTKEHVEWHQIVFFGPQAEQLSAFVSKGSLIEVERNVRRHTYEKEGVTRLAYEIRGEDYRLLDRRPTSDDGVGSSTWTLPPTPSRLAMICLSETSAPPGRRRLPALFCGSIGPLSANPIHKRLSMTKKPVRTARLQHLLSVAIAAVVAGLAGTAHAASAGMPWEGPIMQLVASLTGPVAKGFGIVAIVVTALGMALAEGGHAMKKFITIIFALCVAFSAAQFGLPLLGFSGGVAL
jgi:single stranded DNA-binding protein